LDVWLLGMLTLGILHSEPHLFGTAKAVHPGEVISEKYLYVS